MREIHISKIIEAVKELCVEANYYLSDDVRNTLYHAKKVKHTISRKYIRTNNIKF